MKNRYFKLKSSGKIAKLGVPDKAGVVVLIMPDGTEKRTSASNLKLIAEPVTLAPDDPLPDEPPRCYSYFLDFLLYSPSKPGQVQKRRSVNGFYKSLKGPKPSDNAIRKWSEQFNWMERAMEYDFEILKQKRQYVREQRSKQMLGTTEK